MGDNWAETGQGQDKISGGHTNGGYLKKLLCGLAHINPQF